MDNYDYDDEYEGGKLYDNQLKIAEDYAKAHPKIIESRLVKGKKSKNCGDNHLEEYRKCKPKSHYNRGYGKCMKTKQSEEDKMRGVINCGLLTRHEKAIIIARAKGISIAQAAKELPKIQRKSKTKRKSLRERAPDKIYKTFDAWKSNIYDKGRGKPENAKRNWAAYRRRHDLNVKK